jgi:hypothetical protein
MIKAFRSVLCLCLFAIFLTQARMIAEAQINTELLIRIANGEFAKLPQTNKLPGINTGDFRSLVLPSLQFEFLPPPFTFSYDSATLLHSAIARRIGIRYRFFGTDDRGYDCSGFVWRVFKEAGADFDRVAARTLWEQLPEATDDEIAQFGTLVFFNGLKHIGIVRNADSFYHASRSQGVTLSYFDGYWERRITGYRRAPALIFPIPPRPAGTIE